MKNKVILLTLLVVFLLFFIYHYNNLENDKHYPNLAMMIQDNDGNYVKKSSEKWPDQDYFFSSIKTKCNGEKYLKWDEGKKAIVLESNAPKFCEIYFGKKENIKTFEYTGGVQEFIPSVDGLYKIELWGASGGDINEFIGGNGAYTSGLLNMTTDDKIYIYVGEEGSTIQNGLTYNSSKSVLWGGGLYGATGGGATDIRLVSGNWDNFESLKTRIMVAAGGGGAGDRNGASERYGAGNGGYGGALVGGDGDAKPEEYTSNNGSVWGFYYGSGGTQVSGGAGVIPFECSGGIYTDYNRWNSVSRFGYAPANQAGGGGGYYAGGSAEHAGAGGGSSYISGYEGCVAIKEDSTIDNVLPKDNCTDENIDIECSYHYSGKKFINAEMKSGNELMPTFDDADTMLGNKGNGYARITLVEAYN